MFANREDAGRQLAERLERYRGEDAVVLALPRGGVVVGYEIARVLHCPLDIIAVRKIGHPNNPEYAICATDEKGTLLCNEEEWKRVDKRWLTEETERERREAARRLKVYRGDKKPTELGGKTAIITDDGIATGLTMRLAVAAVKAQAPKRIVVAVPVAPAEVVRDLSREIDELIVLLPPEEFLGAVGAHYAAFEQVQDAEVIRLLRSL
ncbi:MAG: phosphoribosyltransferase family protein [Patescibacteria group bacterium]